MAMIFVRTSVGATLFFVMGSWKLLRLPGVCNHGMLGGMRVCIQRVCEARVVVEGQVTGEIGAGLLVLLGVCKSDTDEDLHWLAKKVANLRIFEDEQGKMNRSLLDVGGAMLVVSQFTLYGDCRKGRRPSFIEAAEPEMAETVYEQFVAEVRKLGIGVETGRFRADMKVSLTNDGPVTLWIDSAEMGRG